MHIVFSEITCNDLVDTGKVYDKQDPCVKITLGNGHSFTTPR